MLPHRRSIRPLLSALGGVLCLAALLLSSTSAQAAEAKPAWLLSVTAAPTNFAPGSVGSYFVLFSNVGGKASAGPVTVTDTLPDGLIAKSGASRGPASTGTCVVLGQKTVECTSSAAMPPGRAFAYAIVAEAEPGAPASVLNEVKVEGGGAPPAFARVSTQISSTPAPFGILSGFQAPLNEADGSAATLAGSHPYQLSTDFNFPTEEPNHNLGAAGHLRDAGVDFPSGEIINPAATPVLCTEEELTNESPGCPDASQVGTATIMTSVEGPSFYTSRLFNMVPPPGSAAELAFNAFGTGIMVHITGGVRSDGDYGITGASADALAFTGNPIFGIRLQLWGDPSDHSHDESRHAGGGHAIEVEPNQTAMLTLPGSCSGEPLTSVLHADSWEEPDAIKEAGYQSADLAGSPVSISGCNALEFTPTIASQPTTNLVDSPSGLDFTLHQPQNTKLGPEDEDRSTAALEDATVTLPAGMSVNPSQADGLGACSEAQIGFEAQKAGIHFSKQPDSCPAASKLGTVEVTTTLLAEYEEEGTKLVVDPVTGEPVPRPLHGAVYLAKPFENPFGSLVAIYLSIDDPQSGTISKLAGKASLDPQTGQITTRFEENPQLPLEDVKLHLFGGARGALITPPTCGAHTTTTDLTPWSSPEGQDALPTDSFQTTAIPGGGVCPSLEAAAPNQPAFSAGTLAPQAGAYSPFVLKLSREDGSQRLSAIDTTLAPGLIGKLAGISACSGAQIAQAQARSHPNEGAIEQAGPSCPAASEVGAVTVGAGAGPNPFYVQGHAYLAGPYKGAPLSLAIITPAIAGPFDLGAVVSRVALNLDRDTAQIHAVSDPLPTILDGIPLDIRSIALKMGRPNFTLNPTSCNPLAITGAATSLLGQVAALTQRFQVGGCQALPFRPKLALKLLGGVKRSATPRLVANLSAKPGEANIAAAQVKLPRAAFLDNAHIKTICTRVQFVADTCPPGSIYGKASAKSPLLDYPLSGPVYLRSNPAHTLPDLVAKLQGPASQPIEIDLAGKTDSVNAALRNTFEAVPDAPVSSFHLELFGGKRGLVELSRNLCAHTYRATVKLTAQSGKVFETTPVMGSSCKGKKGRKHGRR